MIYFISKIKKERKERDVALSNVTLFLSSLFSHKNAIIIVLEYSTELLRMFLKRLTLEFLDFIQIILIQITQGSS